MDCLATAEFGYESYEEAHGRIALRLLRMSQSTTPHKLFNDLLCKFSIVSMLFFCNEQFCTTLFVCNVAVPREEYCLNISFLHFCLAKMWPRVRASLASLRCVLEEDTLILA